MIFCGKKRTNFRAGALFGVMNVACIDSRLKFLVSELLLPL
jgi:hypothetical protein